MYIQHDHKYYKKRLQSINYEQQDYEDFGDRVKDNVYTLYHTQIMNGLRNKSL